MRKYFSLLFIFLLMNICALNAQTSIIDSSKTIKNQVQIKYLHSDSLVGSMVNGAPYNRLMGKVILEHNGTTLHCDSAYLFQEKNYVEAFGNVQINTASGATITSDYLKYTGDNNTCILKKNVTIIDGTNQLQGNDVEYNTITKIAKYYNGATLQSETTTLTSDEGIYNGKTKDAYFKGNVVVTDPKYNVESKELKYNTITKFVTFLDESTIVSDNTTIEGKQGTYDAKKEIGNFSTRSTVSNDDQQITANQMHYDKKSGISNAIGNVVIEDFKNNRKLVANKTDYNEKTGYMKATGNVVMIDEQNNQQLVANTAEYDQKKGDMKATGKVILYDWKNGKTLFAETVDYNKVSKYTKATKNVWLYDSVQNNILSCQQLQVNQIVNYSLATGHPVMRSLADKDSLFMRADSFFSAPSKIIDSIKKKIVPVSTKNDSTAIVNENIKHTLLALGHVIIFTDSMQALCDSMSYAQTDSVFRLYKHPILWTRENQAIADTIYLQTINNKLSQLNLIGNASMISDTKNKNMYDQVYGNKIDGFIIDDALDNMFVDGSAEAIYYTKNEKEEYEGLVKSKSAQLRILLKNKKIFKIALYSEPEGTFTPMDKLTDANRKGTGFLWLDDKRPKNKKIVLQ